MIELTREIRFSADRDWLATDVLDSPVGNSWSGWPVAEGLLPLWRLHATVRGAIDPVLGYVCNVKLLDDVLRRQAIPLAIELLAAEGSRAAPSRFLALAWGRIPPALPAGIELIQLHLAISPYLGYAMTNEHPGHVLLSEQFEFSAAHRLHCPQLGDEANRQLFGKCNNPTGHGHNYVVEVTVRGPVEPAGGQVLPRARLQQVVRQQVIDRFDHKNLNEDTPEFREQNPTVENIARRIWELLVDQLSPALLVNVRVYETPKTWADFRGAT